jgi:hypothetical protein
MKETSKQLNPSDLVATKVPSTGFLHNLMKYYSSGQEEQSVEFGPEHFVHIGSHGKHFRSVKLG